MPILIYCTQLLETGGIESHILEFCEKMAASEVEIDLIVANSTINDLDKKRLKNNCRNVLLNTKWKVIVRHIWLLYVVVTKFTNKYEALYTNGQGKSISLVSKLARYNCWVHHHHTSGDAADQATWSKFYKSALGSATTLIACSNTNANNIKETIKREIDVVPCFSRKIQQKKKEEKSSLNRKLRFGYYGRLVPEKGIDTICQLSEDPECSHIDFHIWGQGEAYPNSFFNNYPQLTYNGTFRSLEELTKVVKFLDAFLLLSIHREGLPISLLEAMSAGLPWLATDRGGIPDIVCDPKSTRVIPHTSSYKKIKKEVLYFESDLRNGLVSTEELKILYRRKFSKPILIEKWKTVLDIS